MLQNRSFSLVALLVALAVLFGSASPVSAAVSSDVVAGTASVNGTVFAMAEVGDRIIIGGSFTEVGGLARQNVAALRPDGTVDPDFRADVNGVVYAVAGSSDGSNVFIGGSFSEIGDTARSNLGAVDAATGQVNTRWQADTDSVVRATTVAGERLYVGGQFRTIDGQAIRRIAALDTEGNVLTSFNPWADWTVKAIVVSPDHSKVYAVGGFRRIASVERPGVAELYANNGRATGFSPQAGGAVITAALSPDGSRLFYATPDNVLHAYDPAVSNAPVYTVKSGGDTQAIAVSDTEVYFGGHFTRLQGFRARRVHMASISLDGTTLTDFDPKVGGRMGVWSALIVDGGLWIGGDFPRVDGVRIGGVALFSGTP